MRSNFAVILLPIFLLLFSAWMLWGWIVGESANIKWMRQICAPTFVCTLILISAGAGAVVSRSTTRNAVREEVATLLESIDRHVRAGNDEKVIQAIRETDRSDDPDRDAFDLLEHLPAMNEPLGAPKEKQTTQIAKASEADQCSTPQPLLVR